MTTPHKHHDLIIAWAKGAKIQYKYPNQSERAWQDVSEPQWSTQCDYRVKPEPKPDVVKYKYISITGSTYSRDAESDTGTDDTGAWGNPANLKLTLDGETGKLKAAEVI